MIGLVPVLQRFITGWGIWPSKIIFQSNCKAWTLNWFNSPTGPFTVFFYCPLFKLALGLQNIKDVQKPIKQINTLQQAAIAISGTLFARWSLIITPRNPGLSAINILMASTGYIQLYRKQRAGQLF